MSTLATVPDTIAALAATPPSPVPSSSPTPTTDEEQHALPSPSLNVFPTFSRRSTASTLHPVAPPSPPLPPSPPTPPPHEATTTPNNALPSTLPPAYLDPAAYLSNPRFHLTHTFTPTFTTIPQTISYAKVGSTSPNAPFLLFNNGMGGHRLAAALLDGICLDKGITLLVFDRPFAGKSSTNTSLEERVQWCHEAFLSLCAHERITSIDILSHSNGVIYTLYTLLHLPNPSPIRIKSWTLSSPYVPPSLSGSLPLLAASYIPIPLTSSFGSLLSFGGKAFSWSSGLSTASSAAISTSAAASSSWSSAFSSYLPSSSSSSTKPSTSPQPSAPKTDSPTSQYTTFALRTELKPTHRRQFGGYYYPPSLFPLAMETVVWKEHPKMESLGLEALICLRRGGGRWWGLVDEEVEAEGKEELERGFERLKELDSGGKVRMEVMYGKNDGLIPPKGRRWLKELLVGKLKLVDQERWTEVEDCGHDDTLGLECLVGPMLDRIVKAHKEEEEEETSG